MLDATETRTEAEVPAGRPARPYGSVVLGAILVVVGALWLLDVMDVVELRGEVVLPAILAVVGLALVVGSFDGPHSGLVVFGVFLTVAVVAVAATPEGAFRGGIGEREFQVGAQEELEDRYDVAAGDLTLDLSELDLTETATVDVTVGAGKMRVLLPDDVAVTIEAAVGAGKVDLLGETTEGLSVTRTYTTPGFSDAPPNLVLDLDVAAGEIEVTR